MHTDENEAVHAQDARHEAQMKRKQALMAQKIAAAQTDRGVLVVNTGVGKGKSTSGFGMLARALGHGARAGVVQFVKGRTDTGERLFFQRFPDVVSFHVMGEGFTWDTQDHARDVAHAAAAWEQARTFLRDPEIGFVLLDELAVALKHELLAVDAVLHDLTERPAHQHVVVTGRGAPEALLEAADTVTDMRLVKHAFKNGVRAQKGIEW